MNAPEPAILAASSTTDLFVTVPETTLPNGTVVPAFQVGTYVCTQVDGVKAAVTAEGIPWVNINFEEAKSACVRAGYVLITERQWLAMAHNIAAQACNWNTGIVGKGRLFQGLRQGTVPAAQAGNYELEDPDEQRWLTFSNGERICDLNGNVFQWIFDDVQGNDVGQVAGAFAEDSASLQAPFASMTKGMGWRPKAREDWSGHALVRGGYWCSESYAGVFDLGSDWPGIRVGDVGFRCTKPIGL